MQPGWVRIMLILATSVWCWPEFHRWRLFWGFLTTVQPASYLDTCDTVHLKLTHSLALSLSAHSVTMLFLNYHSRHVGHTENRANSPGKCLLCIVCIHNGIWFQTLRAFWHQWHYQAPLSGHLGVTRCCRLDVYVLAAPANIAVRSCTWICMATITDHTLTDGWNQSYHDT